MGWYATQFLPFTTSHLAFSNYWRHTKKGGSPPTWKTWANPSLLRCYIFVGKPGQEEIGEAVKVRGSAIPEIRRKNYCVHRGRSKLPVNEPGTVGLQGHW